MSEVKLNLIDNEQVLHGTIHGSVADACVAALSAEPETIAELSAALARYIKPRDDCRPFVTFHSSSHNSHSRPGISLQSLALDTEPWDAGIMIIDLAARIVACESTYSQPQPEGEVDYHDGAKSTDVAVLYRLPDDWLFVNSIEAYQWSRERRADKRMAQPPLDVREVLYGVSLMNFILDECGKMEIPARSFPASQTEGGSEAEVSADQPPPARRAWEEGSSPDSDPIEEALSKELSAIHARWLMTPREDLRGQSPRDVMLARQDFIDFDLHTRSLQWSFQDEGPPCLSVDSFAYRYAGFGTHEWVIYYDLVRHLLWSALDHLHRSARTCRSYGRGDLTPHAGHETLERKTETPLSDRETLLAQLDQLKADWLEQPHPDYDGRIPAILIDNERKRLPVALRPRDMIVDENCPMCQMFGDETSPLGMGVGFWHLDGCNMDDDFAFSQFRTREEWEAENHRREEFSKEFDRKWKERQERIARGEQPDPDPFFDSAPFPGLDDPSSFYDESLPDDEQELPH